MVSLFKDGLIRLVATLSSRMIMLMVSLSSRISSLPPISMTISGYQNLWFNILKTSTSFTYMISE
jgi:hypothetical protein